MAGARTREGGHFCHPHGTDPGLHDLPVLAGDGTWRIGVGDDRRPLECVVAGHEGEEGMGRGDGGGGWEMEVERENNEGAEWDGIQGRDTAAVEGLNDGDPYQGGSENGHPGEKQVGGGLAVAVDRDVNGTRVAGGQENKEGIGVGLFGDDELAVVAGEVELLCQ